MAMIKTGAGGLQLQKSLSRRVSFNDSVLTATDSVVTDIEGQKNPPGKPTSRYIICCAWTSLAVGILTIIILVIGGTSFAFFQSNLPDFNFASLSVTDLAILTAPNGDTLLNANVQVVLNATNQNGKMPVYYSELKADLSSEDLPLGSVNLPDLMQDPHVFTALNVTSVLQNATVAEPDAKEFETKSEDHQLLMDVILGGSIQFVIGGKKMARFPFKALCQGIYQGELDRGKKPKCIVKMTPVS